MYNTGKRIYYKLIIEKSLDGVVQSILELSLLDAFTATGTTYNSILLDELSLYTDTQYDIRYAGFVKYVNDTYYTGFENSILPVGILVDNSCIPTTQYVPTTTVYVPTTIIPTTTVYVPTTTINSCVQISDQLGYSFLNSSDACIQSRDTYFGNNSSFELSTRISANNVCDVTLGGYYSNGVIWKYTSDGMNFITQGICGSSATTTTTTTVLENFWYHLYRCDNLQYYYAGPYTGVALSTGKRVEGATGVFYVIVGTTNVNPGSVISGITDTGFMGC